MLHSVDAGTDRDLDAACAVRVHSDLRPCMCASSISAATSSAVYCWAPGVSSLREHTARAAVLDHIDAVLDVASNHAAHAIDTVATPSASMFEFRREHVVVAVTAGDAERGAGTSMRGPMMSPSLMASRTATSVNPPAPTSRIVVTPASSVAFALAAPFSATRGHDKP